MSTIRAQTLCESDITEDQSRFEMTFVDAAGQKHKISIPTSMVADLIRVLESSYSCRGTGNADFTRLPREFAVGHAIAERMVLLRFDKEPPYAIGVEVAETLTQELQEQIERIAVLRRPAVH